MLPLVTVGHGRNSESNTGRAAERGPVSRTSRWGEDRKDELTEEGDEQEDLDRHIETLYYEFYRVEPREGWGKSWLTRLLWH